MRTGPTLTPLALFDMQSVLPLRHRSQGFLGSAFVAPFREDQAHAHVALDRANDIDPAANRPPAVARLLHEPKALEPAALGERRGVAAQGTAGEVESKEREAMLGPQPAGGPAAPRDLSPVPAERAARA